MEVWKDIKGYEGLYQVSNLGNVKSIRRNRLLKPDIVCGYERVTLSNNKVTKRYLVHRLVAEAFVSNENKFTEVNHKDENKNNNNADNLEWCSHKYNMRYGTRTERSATSRKGKGKTICQYSIDGRLLRVWTSTMDIERDLKIKHSHISRCCKGKRPTAGGFIWKYKKAAQ